MDGIIRIAAFVSAPAQNAPFNPPPSGNPTGEALAVLMAIALGYVAVPGLMIWLLWKFGRRGRENDGEPRCGNCGYLVRGLAELNCPECGADLREVGITRFAAIKPWWRITLWALGGIAGFIAAVGATQLSFGIMTGRYDGSMVEGVGMGAAGAVALVWLLGLLLLIHWHQENGVSAAAPGTHVPSSRRAALDRHAAARVAAPVTRTLTIMFIDMQDYTARTAASSRGAIIELIQRLRRLVHPIVHGRGGMIAKTIGDGLLVTFDSPTEAVLAGGDIQRACAAESSPAGADGDALALRIGLSTGEVAVEDNDVYGDAVNLANRIQQRAESGQVWFSESTFHAMNRNEVPHEEAGTFELKGVGGEVRIFCLAGVGV